jgi:hypothetical protein
LLSHFFSVGALKVVKINAYQDYNVSSYFWPVVTCQKLSSTGASAIIESKDHRHISSLNTGYNFSVFN